MAATKNMTSGSPGRLIISFALPLMLGGVFQQFYTVADAAIVGQVLGVNAIAAVGGADWTIWMIQGIILGMTQGFSIQMAQDFGAKRYDDLKKTVVNSTFLSAVGAVLLLILSLWAAPHILRLLDTPIAVLPDSLVYLYTIICGIPVSMMYNLLSSILRSLGDSRTPLVAIIIVSLLNVGLDFLFVAGFDWGLFGAAFATVLAQGMAAVFCLIKIRGVQFLHLHREEVVLHSGLQLRLLKLGLPLAFQYTVISVGGMVVQYAINGYGVLFMAGFTATNKLYGILEMAASSYGFAIATYTGQNIGAGEKVRVRKGFRAALYISLATSLLIAALMVGLGKYFLLLFITGDPQTISDTLAIAYKYLFIMSVSLPVLYYLHVARSFLQGLGNTFLPMLSGIAEFLMRTGAVLILPLFMGEDGIFYAEVIAWLGADIVLLIGHIYYTNKLKEKHT